MTDLERARALIGAWASDEHRELRLIGKSQAHLPALAQTVALALAVARRESAEAATADIRERLSLRFNNHLVEMKEGYDDSIVGFNEAWDIVRALFEEGPA